MGEKPHTGRCRSRGSRIPVLVHPRLHQYPLRGTSSSRRRRSTALSAELFRAQHPVRHCPSARKLTKQYQYSNQEVIQATPNKPCFAEIILSFWGNSPERLDQRSRSLLSKVGQWLMRFRHESIEQAFSGGSPRLLICTPSAKYRRVGSGICFVRMSGSEAPVSFSSHFNLRHLHWKKLCCALIARPVDYPKSARARTQRPLRPGAPLPLRVAPA